MLRPMPPRVPVGSIRHRPPGHLRPPPTLHTTLLLTSTLRHHYSISSPDARAHSLKSSYSKQRHQSWSAPAATMGAQNSNKVGPAGTAAVQTGGPQVLPADKAPWEGGAVESQMQHRGRKSSIIISSKSSGGSGGSSSSGGSNSSGSVEPDGASTNSSGTSGGSNSSGGSDGSSGSGSATPGGRGSSSSSSSRGGTDGKGGSSGSGSVTPGDPYSSISNSSVGSSASSAGGTAPWEVTPAAASPKKRKSSSSSSSSSSKGGRGKEASPSSGILNGVGGSGGSGPAGSERRQGTSGAPVANNQDKGLLLLIDGHSMAHRSFGAMAHSKIGGLKTSQGISTSATAGFLKTITAAVRDQKPSAMAITFDDAISFRKPMHALLSYLADEQRSGMSDDEYVDMVKGICTLLKPPTPEAAAQAAQQQLGVGVPPSVAVDVRMLPGMVAAKLSKEVAQTALTAPDEEGKGYKATRKERPMGFDEDVHNLRQLLSAMRLPVISGGGSSLEADDLLAGLATQGAAAGYEVKIVSGDQDLLQLVDDRKRISVLEPSGPQTPRSAGSSAFKQLDETGVVAKLGVLPTQVPDYKAMVGDASDNVPGVAGIGPKNGHSLLASYGSLDGVYSNLSKISKGMRTKLEQGRRKAYMSRFLCALSDERLLNAGLHTGIFANIDALRLQGFHKAEVEPLMEALEMNSALKTLPTLQALLGGEAAQPSTSPLTPRDLILSPPPLEQPSALSSSIAEAGNRLVGAGSNVADAGDHWAESGRASAGADALSHAAASASSQQAGVGSAPNVTGSQSPAAPDAGSHQAGAGSVTFAVPDAQSHAAVEAADRCMGEAEGTAAAAAGNAQAATAAQQHAAATAAAAAAEATPGAAAAPAIADLHFLPGPRTPARSRAVTDQAPLPAANANGTTPAGGKKATVSVSAAGTRRRRTVRGVPSLSPSSPSPPPSSQHADLTARSPASGSPSLTPAAEGSVAQAPAECPGTPATPEIAASSPAAAVARSAGKVQEPTAVAPPPLPPGGAERNDVAIAAAAAPTVSMPFRPPPEPLVRVPESGIPYSITVGSLDVLAVKSKEELQLWVAQITHDLQAQASALDPAQHLPEKGHHHLPFVHRRHLALCLHFSTRPAKPTKSKKRPSASAPAKSTSGSDADSTPDPNNVVAGDESRFQAPTDLLPPLSGISLCWPRPPTDPHYYAEQCLSSETISPTSSVSSISSTTTSPSASSSSSSSGGSLALPQHALLQAIFVPCPAVKGSVSAAQQSASAGLSPGSLREDEVLEALLPLLHDPTIPKAVFETKPFHHIALRQRAMLPTISAQSLLQGAVMDVLMSAYVLGSEEATGQKCEPDRVAATHQVPRAKVLQGIVSADAAANATEEGAGGTQSDAVRAAAATQLGAAAAAQVWCLAARLGNDLGQVSQATRDLLEETEVPLGELLAEMETLGLGIDIPALNKIVEDVKKKQDEIKEDIVHTSNWNEKRDPNLNGAPDISKILFQKLDLPRNAFELTPSGQLKVAEQSFEQRQHMHPVISKIVSWRKLAYLSNHVVQSLASAADRYSNGRVFPTFLQNAAATGRLAAVDPNVMAINKDDLHLVGGNLRALFVPSVPGWSLLSADYSQVELRINAHFSQEPTLVEAFQRGQDVHATSAMRLFKKKSLEEVTPKERQMAKMTVFGLVYGMGADKLAKDNNITMAEARRFMEHFKSSMPKLNAFMERSRVRAVTQGYLDTLFGRRRRYSFETAALAKLKGRDPGTVASVPKASRQDETTLRCAGNTPLQGTSADIIKRAMVDVHRELRARDLRARILMPIHDELLIEAPPEEHAEVEVLVRRVMIAADKGQLSCPLVVDTAWGANWKEAE